MAKLLRQRVGLGLVLVDEAKAFFTAVENFAHLQASDSSPQRVAFDRSTRCFLAVEGEFAGVSTIGGPTNARAISISARNCSLIANPAEIASRRWTSR